VKNLTAALQPMQDSIQPLLDTISQIDWPTLQTRMTQGCERLAILGWALPMSFTPRELVEIAEKGGANEEIEDYMFEYFTADGGRNFLSLRNNVLRSEDLVGWHALLEECFDSYDRGHYLVLIPALLSVIEGAVAHNAGKFNSSQLKPNKLAADLENDAERDSIKLLIWRSVRLVLDKLFKHSDFKGPPPGELNRHWILHGRDQSQWTQIDAIRLFNLLSTIS